MYIHVHVLHCHRFPQLNVLYINFVAASVGQQTLSTYLHTTHSVDEIKPTETKGLKSTYHRMHPAAL